MQALGSTCETAKLRHGKKGFDLLNRDGHDPRFYL